MTAWKQNAELGAKAIQFESLKKELSDLYSRIFDGPTIGMLCGSTWGRLRRLIAFKRSPEFPEDDRLEYRLRTSQSMHDQIQSTLNSECQAAEILARADRTMDGCRSKMQEALGYSQWGTFLVKSRRLICLGLTSS
jgi:hypothetical protein